MADKKSREEIKEKFRKAQFREEDLEELTDTAIALGEASRLKEEHFNISDIVVKIEADVSGVLKGLKAIRQEVRKTMRAIKELEEGKTIKINGKEVAEKVYKDVTELQERDKRIRKAIGLND